MSDLESDTNTNGQGINPWGSSDPDQIHKPHLERNHKQKMEIMRFDKKFQLTIVSIFLLFIAVLTTYDYFILSTGSNESRSRFSELLTVTVPIFTFLLGMGTQSGNQK